MSTDVYIAAFLCSYFCKCCTQAVESIVQWGKLCCWEGYSNWIVDKSSLRSTLALLLMQVNNHLNGSCLLSDWKTGGKKKQAAGGQHLNVNNHLFNACPAFRESETCSFAHSLSQEFTISSHHGKGPPYNAHARANVNQKNKKRLPLFTVSA